MCADATVDQSVAHVSVSAPWSGEVTFVSTEELLEFYRDYGDCGYVSGVDRMISLRWRLPKMMRTLRQKFNSPTDRYTKFWWYQGATDLIKSEFKRVPRAVRPDGRETRWG